MLEVVVGIIIDVVIVGIGVRVGDGIDIVGNSISGSVIFSLM